MKKTSICWVNGRYLAQPEARVSPFDSGFLYGDGVYDTLRAYRGRIFKLEQHLGRLRENLRFVDIPFSKFDLLQRVFTKLIVMNHSPDAVLRAQITRGVQREFPPYPRFDSPTVLVSLRPVPRYDPTHYTRGVVVTLLEAPFVFAGPKPKSTNFQANLLARLRAAREKAFEAVFISGNRVLEGSMSNIFFVRRGRLFTPRLDGILPGITRSTVLGLARQLQIPAHESVCTVSQLMKADEAFLTSTTLEVMPICKLRRRRRARAYARHPVADALRAAYRKRVEADCSSLTPEP
ncbi:MAG: aminotransferase class IV [Nitrospirae bacterium]|nr:aminotransferase class IV [Nitrospirota bacterium]